MNSEKYQTILHLPHHRSETHVRMSHRQRAAQFSAFAALTGHSSIIREAGRLTEPRRELSEDRKQEIDAVLQKLSNGTPIKLLCFRQDPRKEGGAYITISGIIKQIDPVYQAIVMADRTRIPFEDIYRIKPLPSGSVLSP